MNYLYANKNECCLTPNYLLFKGKLSFFDPETTNHLSHHSSIIKPSKLQNINGHFWERWRRECLPSLQEYDKINEDMLRLYEEDIVITEEAKLNRSEWILNKTEQLIHSKDEQEIGAVISVPKSNSVVKRPVNKPAKKHWWKQGKK